MAKEKPTETLAAIRRRLLAGSPKTAERRVARKPRLTHAEEVRAMQKRAFAKINAEKASAAATPDNVVGPTATVVSPTPSADRLRAARQRGMRRTPDTE